MNAVLSVVWQHLDHLLRAPNRDDTFGKEGANVVEQQTRSAPALTIFRPNNHQFNTASLAVQATPPIPVIVTMDHFRYRGTHLKEETSGVLGGPHSASVTPSYASATVNNAGRRG